jgi:deoxyguanosine kinase
MIYMNFIKTQTDLNILILDISDIDFVKNTEMYDEMLARIVKHSEKNTTEHLSIQKI